jgi:hypothetical protein
MQTLSFTGSAIAVKTASVGLSELWSCAETDPSPGLPATTDSYECTFCRVTFCFCCSLKHEPSHRRALVIVKALRNQTHAQTVEACARCDKPSWYRYSCQTCAYSLCRECWNAKGVNMHRHNRFVVVEPAWTISGDFSQTCCKKASFGHCSFCRTRESLEDCGLSCG